MASITQQIPSYVGGISQQPDELKVPGQLNKAKNFIPDVTHGLIKRPGSRLIGGNLGAYTTDSKWFHYYRDENEQYIGQIQLSTGEIKMWRCCEMTISGTTHAAGSSVTVNYESGQATALKNYLKQTNSGGTITDADLQTLTLNDYTYITNRNKTAAMAATVEPVRPPEAYIELKKIAYASQYSVNLFDNTTLTDVYTATRIEVKRLIDSSNSCLNADNAEGNGWKKGRYPGNNIVPGTGNWTVRCGQKLYSDGTRSSTEEDDSFCPNVDTRIFSIDHGASGDAEDANGVAHTYSVTANGGSAADRKNLYFRIATTGQAVPESNVETVKYHCRYTTTHDLLYGGEGWRQGDVFYVWMNKAKYKVTIKEHSHSRVQANLGLIRPEPTSFDTKTTVTAESILGSIRTGIVGTGNFTDANVQQVGTGIYITRPSGTFNITSPVGELLNVLAGSIEDVADLPNQCKHGYVVRINNSEAEEDDYYVKFFGENDRDGDGVWEECPEPGVKTTLDPATMPIQIVRQADGTFKVEQVAWDIRQVGDTTTVPEPSFIGKTINKMLFFRNRMVMLSDENVIISRPGDFYNFWPKSAITFTATDNIDISCSSEYPAIVYDGLQVNSGLVLFTKNQQFMLTTDSDVLSPLTAKINSLASYNFNFNTNPVSLGTTIAFLDNAGKYTRFFEMQAVLREGEPNVLEQSKLISKLFPKDIDIIANSRENSTIFFGIKGTNKLYGFRYYSVAEQRIQQAWFEWELSGEIQHIAMLDDALFAIIKNGSNFVMQKFAVKIDTDEQMVTEDIDYRIHLDNKKIIASSALTYDASNNWTKFTFPAGLYGSGQLCAYSVATGSDKEFNGQLENVTTFDDNGTTKVKLSGNWKTYVDSDGVTQTPANNIVLGYLYDSEIELPTIYVNKQVGDKYRSDITSSLVVHRVKFSFGPSGVYKVILSKIGKETYTHNYESTPADSYAASGIGVEPEQIVTVPVYEKNKNLTISVKSTHPSPATLYSMAWEGDYTDKFYKRV